MDRADEPDVEANVQPDVQPDVADVRSRRVALEGSLSQIERPWTHEVAIVAVTKGFPESIVEVACAAGFGRIGENYAQELIAKRATVERLGPEVHFIGRLQSNKIRQLVGLVDVWSSIDRTSVIDELGKRAPDARIRIQVNATGEAGKGGCEPDAVASLVARARERRLVVEGLMTVGPTGEPPEAARVAFRTVRSMVDDHGLEVCSMGMSADLVVAVEEGTSEVRVGTALFGPRP